MCAVVDFFWPLIPRDVIFDGRGIVPTVIVEIIDCHIVVSMCKLDLGFYSAIQGHLNTMNNCITLCSTIH
jgi:hypothetical protein